MQTNTNKNSDYSASLDYARLSRKIDLAQIFMQAKLEIRKSPAYIRLLAFFTITVLLALFGFIAFLALSKSIEIGGVLFILSFFIFSFFIVLALIYNNYKELAINNVMADFARINNLGFIANKKDPAKAGLIFSEGHSRILQHAFQLPKLYNAEIGNYSFTTGSGKSSKIHNYGYLMFEIPRNVPHMLLDAKDNNFMGMFSNLPTTFRNNQSLSLEGDFNNFFTLYAPKEYETDALYIFTPDVMRVVIENAKTYDIEIIDNKVYLYTAQHLNLTSKQVIAHAIDVISTLARQLYEQTDNYADETISNRSLDSVAQQGKRLNKSHVKLAIQLIATVAFLYIFLYFSGDLSFLPLFIGASLLAIVYSLKAKK